jgi:hypothetical protein
MATWPVVNMLDLVFLATGAALLGACVLYALVCDRL